MSVFFDTNILVYAISSDPRREVAQQALARGGTVSVQVLNECANVLRRKLNQPWPWILDAIAALRAGIGDVRPLTVATHDVALRIARDHAVSFYDALILAAAQEARCDTLFSEDLQHGWKLNGLTITNPFR